MDILAVLWPNWTGRRILALVVTVSDYFQNSSNIYRYYSDKNHKFGFISMARNAASMKSPNPLPLLSDCASASVNEAVIHNQPWLIKRLSRDVPPQWVGWLSAVATDRNRAEFYCPRWTLLSFHFTSSLHLFFLFCHALSLNCHWSPRGFRTLEKLKASDSSWLSPLNSTKGNTGSVYRRSLIIFGWRQCSGGKWGIRELRLQTAGLWFRENKEGEKETDWDGKLADYKIISGADLFSLKLTAFQLLASDKEVSYVLSIL